MRGLSLSIALFVAVSSASAQDADTAAARAHYDAAVSYYEQLRYEDAAREFREAYELSHRTHLLKNVATSLQHARLWSQAADTYDEYIAAEPDADDRASIEARVRRLRELAASESRGEETSEADVPEPEPLDGASTTTPPEPADESAPVLGIALTVAGGALGVGALVVGLMAHGVYTDLDDACDGGRCTDPGFEDDRDRGRTLAITSTVLTAGAVVAGGIGLVLWALHGAGDDGAPPPVDAQLGPGGLGLTARGAF